MRYSKTSFNLSWFDLQCEWGMSLNGYLRIVCLLEQETFPEKGRRTGNTNRIPKGMKG